MRSAKKFITVLALLALCLTLMAVSAFAADTTRYYCKAPDSWTECYVYFWSSSDFNMTTWPGEAMTQGEDGIWYYDVPDAASMVIFNKNGSPQTADLVKPTDGNNLYIYEEDPGRLPVSTTLWTTPAPSAAFATTAMRL